ncbi:MAG: hypothetical protein WBJ22_01770 [Minisyncoccales bacterium]
MNQNTWEETAVSLGYDYRNKWQDNIKMGIWIYENYGKKPWNWSRMCWK